MFPPQLKSMDVRGNGSVFSAFSLSVFGFFRSFVCSLTHSLFFSKCALLRSSSETAGAAAYCEKSMNESIVRLSRKNCLCVLARNDHCLYFYICFIQITLLPFTVSRYIFIAATWQLCLIVQKNLH